MEQDTENIQNPLLLNEEIQQQSEREGDTAHLLNRHGSKTKTESEQRLSPVYLLALCLICVSSFSLLYFLLISVGISYPGKQTLVKFAEDMGILPAHGECSYQGIYFNGKCHCDLGFKGKSCQEQFDIKNIGTGVRNKVILVVDHFSPSDSSNPNGIAATTLANLMVKTGFNVDVLVINTNPQFKSLQKIYQQKKINLLHFPLSSDKPFLTRSKTTESSLHSTSLKEGPVSISYQVYEYLVENNSYEIVFFFSSFGVGYYTLLAQRQGLACFKSHLVVGFDSLSPELLERLRHNDKDYVVTDINLLKADYMQLKSLEMADTLVAPSKAIVQYAEDIGWKIADNVYSINQLPLGIVQDKQVFDRSGESSQSKLVNVREFVFVGNLGVNDGLIIFLNAIDKFISRNKRENGKLLETKAIRVTFIGINQIIDSDAEIMSETYIEMRSYAWGNSVKLNIHKDINLKKIICYLTDPGKGRVAVFPGLVETSGFLLQQSLHAGIPLITSNLGFVEEMVHEIDYPDIIFNKNSTVALTDKMINVFQNGVTIPRPADSIKKIENTWKQMFADLQSLPFPLCPASFVRVPYTISEVDDIPLVTVVLVHHNRHALLQQAIESLEQQTFTNFEVVLVDDGSTDNDSIQFLSDLSWKWWQERAWKVLREPNRYLGAARNTGARQARGKYILFMDDDDYAKPHQIETFVRVAESTGADIVTSGHDLFEGYERPRERDALERYVPLGDAKLVGILENCFGDSSMFVHREFFLDSGGFTEDFGIGFEDYEFLARAVLRNHRLEAISEPLHWYRKHLASMSHTTDLKANQMRFLRAYVDYYPKANAIMQGLVRFAQHQFFERIFIPTTDSNTTTIVQFSSITIIRITTRVFRTVSVTRIRTLSVDRLITVTRIIRTGAPGKPKPTTTETRTKTVKTACIVRKSETIPRILTRKLPLSRYTNTITIPNIRAPTTCDFCKANLVRDLKATAQYSDNGMFITVDFNANVLAPVNVQLNCDDYFDITPVDIIDGAYLSDNLSECYVIFPNLRQMRIYNSFDFLAANPDTAPAPNKYLSWKENALGSSQVTPFQVFVGGVTLIKPPANPVTPSIFIKAPSLVGPCFDLIVDLSGSSGNANRPFSEARFNFTTNAPANSLFGSGLLMQQTLQNAADNVVYANDLIFEVPPLAILPNIKYTIYIYLKNFFGKAKQISFSFQKTDSDLVPLVLIDGPSLATSGQITTLFAQAFPTSCGVPNLDFKWVYISGPDAGMILNNPFSSSLTIPQNLLSDGQHIFGLDVTSTLNGIASKFSYQHTVYIGSGVLNVFIGGGSRSLGPTDPIGMEARIYGAGSITESLFTEANYNFNWGCFIYETTFPCTFSNGTLITYPNAKSWVLPARTLRPNAYNFILTVVNKNEAAETGTSSVIITMNNRKTPGIFLNPSDYLPSANDIISIRAILNPQSISRNLLKYEWSSAPYCGGKLYTSTSVLNFNVTSFSSQSVFNIQPGILTPGFAYCIQLNVTDPVNPIPGNAYVIIHPKNPIGTTGNCQITGPTTGFAYVTEFGIRCSGYETDTNSYPLSYRFKLRSADDLITLGPATQSPLSSFVLQDGVYTLEVDVIDTSGATISYITNTTLTVLPPPAQNITESLVNGKVQEFVATKNLLGGYSSLSILALNLYLDSIPLSLCISQMLKVIKVILDNTQLDLTDSGPLLISYMSRLGNVGLQPEFHENFLTLLQMTLSQMSAWGISKNTCFSHSLAYTIVSLLDPILIQSDGPHHASQQQILTTKSPLISYADFLYNITNTMESCLQRNMNCESKPFRGKTALMDLSVGIFQTEVTGNVPLSLCGFDIPNTLPVLLKAYLDSDKCLGFRCNSMKINLRAIQNNGTSSGFFVDKTISELSFRNPTAELHPLFRGYGNTINFTLPISQEFQERIQQSSNSLVPYCIFYDMNSRVWSSEGCRTSHRNKTTISCRCNHLTEFSVGLLDKNLKVSESGGGESGISLRDLLLIIFGSLLFVAGVIGSIFYYYWRKKKNQQKKQVQSKVVIAGLDDGDDDSSSDNNNSENEEDGYIVNRDDVLNVLQREYPSESKIIEQEQQQLPQTDSDLSRTANYKMIGNTMASSINDLIEFNSNENVATSYPQGELSSSENNGNSNFEDENDSRVNEIVNQLI